MKELQLLRKIISAILNPEEIPLVTTLLSEEFDLGVFDRLAAFHSIRPAVGMIMSQAGIEKEGFQKYIDVFKSQAINDLMAASSLGKTLDLLKNNGIEVIPYKGVLFVHEVYEGLSIRESSDIDLLFKVKDLKKALTLFSTIPGFTFQMIPERYLHQDTALLSDLFLDSEGMAEVPVKFDNQNWDIHWGLYYGFLQFDLDYNSLFEQVHSKRFYGQEREIPNPSLLFKMIVVHHGAKENWYTFKSILDLIFFNRKYKDLIDWKQEFLDLKKAKMYNIALTGFYLLKHEFGQELHPHVERELQYFKPKAVKSIVSYWQYAVYWSDLRSRLKYEFTLFKLRDEGFSWVKYLYGFYQDYSKVGPLNDDLFIKFPNSLGLLNFTSKVLTYVVKRITR